MEDIRTLLDLFGINTDAMIAGIIFGFIGYWIYRQGKKPPRPPLVVIGILLMIYPYFVESTRATWAVGFGLCAAARYFWNRTSASNQPPT